MGIDVDIDVEIPHNQDEVVEGLLGLEKLKWTDESFKENIKSITTSLLVSVAHIDESKRQHKNLIISEKKLITELEKEYTAAGLKDEPTYPLYSFALARCDILNKIITYTSLQSKILIAMNNEMNILLCKAFEYGAISHKIENEYEILKDTRVSLREAVKTIEDMRKEYFTTLREHNAEIINITRKINNIPEKDITVDVKKTDDYQKTLNELYELREYKKNHIEESNKKNDEEKKGESKQSNNDSFKGGMP